MNSANPHLFDRQPRALVTLFLTEMWERFSYWALFSLLVMYMIKTLDFSESQSYLIFAAFNALMFAAPIIGGWVADKLITTDTAVIHGSFWLSLGYILLSFAKTPFMTYLALSPLIVGMGFLKPNISATLGLCYHENDNSRQRGFTLFYMGINIGALAGSLGCGWIAMRYGWHTAILTVATTMVLAGIYYYWHLPNIRKEFTHTPSPPTLMRHFKVFCGSALCTLPCLLLLDKVALATWGLVIIVLWTLFYIFRMAFKLPKEEKNRMFLCLILICFSIVFFSLYMQMGSLILMYLRHCIDNKLGPIHFTSTMTVSIASAWLLLLSPFFISLWGKLEKKKRDPRTDTKFFLGLLLIGMAFLLLRISVSFYTPGNRISLWWLVGSYGLQSIGEICLSPIGLAMVTELAPLKAKGLFMGIWFMGTAIASIFSGYLAKLGAVPPGLVHLDELKHLYGHAFTVDYLIAFAAAFICLFMIPWMRRFL